MLNAAVEDIKRRSKTISTREEVTQVGTISANGQRDIGEMMAEAMEKDGKEGAVTIEEAKSLETELEIVEGMQFDRGYISPYFVTNPEKMTCELEDAHIFLYDKKLSSHRNVIRPTDISNDQNRTIPRDVTANLTVVVVIDFRIRSHSHLQPLVPVEFRRSGSPSRMQTKYRW